MKDVRFYAVMPISRKSKSASKSHPFDPFTIKRLTEKADAGERVECFALDVSDARWRYNPGGAGLVFDPEITPDFSAIGWTGVSLDWLSSRCVRISEELAQRLHPEIVRYME